MALVCKVVLLLMQWYDTIILLLIILKTTPTWVEAELLLPEVVVPVTKIVLLPAILLKATCGNTIEGNLWGVTILALSGGVPISGSMPNLGNINNSDTSDNGKNRFINNTNASTPGIDLYNNSIDPIFAMGNYWNTATEAEIEPKIFHQADNAAHGLVTYSNAILPVELLSFSGSRNGATATLLWATAQEINSHSFVLEKSFNGTSFSSVATVNASGNSNSTKNYSFTHLDANPFGGYIYYRLKSVDIDGRYSYSNVLAISFPTVQTKLIRHYPSLLQAGELMQLEIAANKNRSAKIQWIDAGGKIMATNKIMLQTGFNHFNVAVPSIAAKGLLLLKITTDDGFSKTIKVVLQ